MIRRWLTIPLLALLWSGLASAQSFVPVYATKGSPAFLAANETLRQLRFLETMADAVSRLFITPSQIGITVAECGTPNAYFRALANGRGLVTLCHELMQQINARSAEAARRGQRLPDGIEGEALTFIFLHEIGHGLIHQLGIPTLGGEEDAADAIAAYIFLNTPVFGDRWLNGPLWFFSQGEGLTRSRYSDEHSLNPQRQATVACLAYGKEPQRYARLVGTVLNPQRAGRCAREYQQVDAALRQQFGSRFRPEGAPLATATSTRPAATGGFAASSRAAGQSCNSNSDCSGSLRCEQSICTGDAPAAPTTVFRASSRLVGESCNSNSDCSGQARCEAAVCTPN